MWPPQYSSVTGIDCISLSRVTDRGKGCKTDTSTSMKGFQKQLAATVTTGVVASHLIMLRFKPQDHKVVKTEATHIHNTCMIKFTNGPTVHREVPKGRSPESSDKISQSSANPRSSDSSKVTTLRTPGHPESIFPVFSAFLTFD